MKVVCSSCSKSYDMNQMVLADKINRGDVVRKITPHDGWEEIERFGICDDCQAIHKADARRPKRGSVEQEAQRYQKLIAKQRELHPTWSLRSCVREAGKEFHDPRNEPDPGFRAYLLDR